MEGCDKPVTFSSIVQKSDPDCFAYNYAQQGELDLGLGAGWQTIDIPDGEVFLSFDDHKAFIEAKLNLRFMMLWEPDPNFAPKEQATIICASAIKMLVTRHILWSDSAQIRSIAVELIQKYGIGDELNDLISAEPN